MKLLLKEYVNMFELMEIMETIFEGVVEPYYRKTTREYANLSGRSRKNKEESASSKFYSDMGKCSEKRNQRCVNFSRDR